MKFSKKITFAITLLLLSFSCEKDNNNDNNLEILNFEIRLLDAENLNCKGYYKYDSQGKILSYKHYDFDNGGEYLYHYSGENKIPTKIEYVPKTNGGYYSTTYFDFQDSILTLLTIDDIAEYTTKYILNDKLKPLFKLDQNNDTLAYYNYENFRLEAIHYNRLETVDYTVSRDSFIYNESDQLIEVISYLEQNITHRLVYQYNGEKLSGIYDIEDNTTNGTEYSYTDLGTLSKITSVQILGGDSPIKKDFLVNQYNYFEPINMNPVNFHNYPYLRLPRIHN